jgi:hypothetical protein
MKLKEIFVSIFIPFLNEPSWGVAYLFGKPANQIP